MTFSGLHVPDNSAAQKLNDSLQKVKSIEKYKAFNAVIKPGDEVLPQLLRGLEEIFRDGLQRETFFWSFAKHSVQTMKEDDRRKYNNPAAQEQVSEVIVHAKESDRATDFQWQGRLWLLLCLNTQSLLDAVTSLTSRPHITKAHYEPSACLADAAQFRLLYALLNQLHKLRFKLYVADLCLFEENAVASPAAQDDASPALITGVVSIKRKTVKKGKSKFRAGSIASEDLRRLSYPSSAGMEAARRFVQSSVDGPAIDPSDDPTRGFDTLSEGSMGSAYPLTLEVSPGQGSVMNTPGPSDISGGKRSRTCSDMGSVPSVPDLQCLGSSTTSPLLGFQTRSPVVPPLDLSLRPSEPPTPTSSAQAAVPTATAAAVAAAASTVADGHHAQGHDPAGLNRERMEHDLQAQQLALAERRRELEAWEEQLQLREARLKAQEQSVASPLEAISSTSPEPPSSPISPMRNASEPEEDTSPQLSGSLAPPLATRPVMTIALIVRDTPKRSRADLHRLQQGHCHDCGGDLCKGLFSKPRRCHYLDHLFCHQCHSNQKAMIPAKALNSWDFSKYPVCQGAYAYLSNNHSLPNLRIGDAHPDVVRKCPLLQNVQAVRHQLIRLGHVIRDCPNREFARPFNDCFSVKCADLYSLAELHSISLGHELFLELVKLRQSLSAHCTSQCEVCHRRSATRCPACAGSKEIFPWDMDTNEACPKCSTLHHRQCLHSGCRAPKCNLSENRLQTTNPHPTLAASPPFPPF